MHFQTISKWERGDRKNVSSRDIKKLAVGLGIDEAELLKFDFEDQGVDDNGEVEYNLPGAFEEVVKTMPDREQIPDSVMDESFERYEAELKARGLIFVGKIEEVLFQIRDDVKQLQIEMRYIRSMMERLIPTSEEIKEAPPAEKQVGAAGKPARESPVKESGAVPRANRENTR